MPGGQRQPPRRSVPGTERPGSHVARVRFTSYANVDFVESERSDFALKFTALFQSEFSRLSRRISMIDRIGTRDFSSFSNLSDSAVGTRFAFLMSSSIFCLLARFVVIGPSTVIELSSVTTNCSFVIFLSAKSCVIQEDQDTADSAIGKNSVPPASKPTTAYGFPVLSLIINADCMIKSQVGVEPLF